MATKILIVDDSAFMRAMLRGILVSEGFDIVGEACNGREAVDLFEELKPDLVTMDMVMPEMGGMEALQIIRGSDGDAKVVIVSAVDQRENLLEAIRSGATEYIVKPFDAPCVLKAINRALGTSQTELVT